MKMTKVEKLLVNSRRKADKNIKIAEQLFNQIDISKIEKGLEVGCGIGMLSSYLVKKYNWELTGIDLDPEQIAIAKKNNIRHKNLKFLKSDVKKLPFEESKFDIVLCFDVMHHIPHWKEALKEISRVLKPGSFFILSDIAMPKLIVFKNLFKNYGGFYSVDDITEYLKENNFEVAYKEKLKGGIVVKHFRIIFRKIYQQ